MKGTRLCQFAEFNDRCLAGVGLHPLVEDRVSEWCSGIMFTLLPVKLRPAHFTLFFEHHEGLLDELALDHILSQPHLHLLSLLIG